MVSSRRAGHACHGNHRLSNMQAQALTQAAEKTGRSMQAGLDDRSARPELRERCPTYCEGIESIFDLGGPLPYVQVRGPALHDADALQDVDDIVDAALLDS
jgi:hypothetical protein